MTASYVTLILDVYDAAGNPVTQGTASLVPSMEIPDTADQMLIVQAPLTAAFRTGTVPQLRLVSTDSVGPQPQGWTWTITFTGVPGSPASFSFFLSSAGGATQHLSALAQVPAAQPGQQYLPLPNGTAATGQVPVATGSGETSAWAVPAGTVLAQHVYAPGTQQNPVVNTGTMTAFDSANIQTGAFTVPPSGAVAVRASFVLQTNASSTVFCFGLADHGTVTPIRGNEWVITSPTGSPQFGTIEFTVSGLTAGASHPGFDLLGACSGSTPTLTLHAVAQSSTTPNLSGGQQGAPVTLTVTAN